MTAVSHLWGILLEPAKSWRALSERTSAWLPLVAMIAAQIVAMYAYYQNVDGPWLIDQMIAGMGDASPDEIAAARSYMSIGTMMWGGIISIAIVVPIIMAILGLYYHLVSKTMGAERKFGQWFGFSVWASWPSVLMSVIALVLIYTASSGEIEAGVMNATSIAYLAGISQFSKWGALLGSLSLITFWQIALAAIGFREWTQRSMTTSLFVAAAPSVIIFGIWALFVAL